MDKRDGSSGSSGAIAIEMKSMVTESYGEWVVPDGVFAITVALGDGGDGGDGVVTTINVRPGNLIKYHIATGGSTRKGVA